MIIVTGAAGFIGSNLVRGLNSTGRSDIVVVDDLSDGTKFRNLVDCDFLDYLDKDEFMSLLSDNPGCLDDVKVVFHQGACSDTRERDGKYMLENNYAYSTRLLERCISGKIPFIYASSAAVYGVSRRFEEKPECEKPLNLYGYSKLLFDRYARRALRESDAQVAGLRYFNVYGPYEQHKGAMSSMAFQLNNQLIENGEVNLFKASGGYENGGQRRDFIYIDDVVDVNLWFMNNRRAKGIFNVGTGKSRSFNDVAGLIINWHNKGEIDKIINYVDFPEGLLPAYQSFTEANISGLREVGYKADFTELEEGINQYLNWLN